MVPDTKAVFEEIEALLAKHEPLDLLTQLTMTFLFFPAGQHQGEDSEPVRWQRYIEFLAGYVLVRPYPTSEGLLTDGATLQQVEEKVNAYFNALDLSGIGIGSPPAADNGVGLLLSLVTSYARHVRGHAYPHQLIDYARALYSTHDAWFKAKLGFTIEDAIRMMEAIANEYSHRKGESKKSAIEQAKATADELISSGQATEQDRPNIESSYGCHYHYGDSVNVLGFTVEELTQFAQVPADVAAAFLARMSQEFGYRNPDFPNTFTDSEVSTTDYNTLNERPIVAHDGRYWVLVLPILKSALMTTFYFDLIRDKTYRPTFDAARGAFLEQRSAEYLRRVFPPSAVFLNPSYPNNEEFCDVLVLYDRKILILQNKSKLLTHAANIGESLDKLKDDLKKGVKDAFEQGVRARDYLNASSSPTILIDGIARVLDMTQVNGIHVINVTLMPFQNLTTRFANHPGLNLFPDGLPLWSLSIGALDILTLILHSPARFLHYLNRRLEIEKTSFAVLADEMDLLGYYLIQGMYFADPALGGIDSLGITGMSVDIDKYIFERFDAGLNPPLPKPPMPPGYEELLHEVETFGGDYSTDCAVGLLNLSGNSRGAFIAKINEVKGKAISEGGRPIVSMLMEDGKTGFSFLVVPKGTSQSKLSDELFVQATLRKYKEKRDTWIALGGIVDSPRSVDASAFLSFPWEQDDGLDQLASATTKPTA